MKSRKDIIVAGHICLDIIPTFPPRKQDISSVMSPGKLVDVGPAVIATGGAVSNTGLALHRLGIKTGLMGKIGNDELGRMILDTLGAYAPDVGKGMIAHPSAPTSYTVVLSPPGMDRVFLHCPGANDTYCSADIDCRKLHGAKLFHFGYPPLMKRMYSDGGIELAKLLRKVKRHNLATSLDLAKPDPDSDAGRVDWIQILRQILPHTDIFLPSFDELLFMLDRKCYDKAQRARQGVAGAINAERLAQLSGQLLAMGAGIVVIKLGDRGLYLRTTHSEKRLERIRTIIGKGAKEWIGRELLAPCFNVKVVGTTGSGDCTIAGFLAAFIKGCSPEKAVTAAVAVGACSVETADATSGIPTWSIVQKRIAQGWKHRKPTLSLRNWHTSAGVYLGLHDSKSPL